MGASTSQSITDEVPGHAFAIIEVFDLILLLGKKLQLIKMYNQWNKEIWDSNPWADSSSEWTAENFENLWQFCETPCLCLC